MINVTSETLKYLQNGGYVSVTLDITTVDLDTFQITNANILEQSFSISKNSISGSSFEIGNTECAELLFGVVDTQGIFSSYKFEGAEVIVTFNVNGELISGGTFFIDNKPSKKDVFKITALDKMIKFNKTYQSDLGNTATLKAILLEACSKCGITCKLLNHIGNLDYVATVPHTEKTTYHEVIGWVAQLCGMNGFIDVDGYFRLGWYGEQQIDTILPVQLPVKLGGVGFNDITIPIDGTVRYVYEAVENNVSITGVSYDDGKNDIVLIGTNQVVLEVPKNPLIKVGDVEQILNFLYNKLVGFTYRPSKMTIAGYPHITTMDMISVTSPDGELYNTIISNIIYTLNGTSKIEARGKTEEECGYANPKVRFNAAQLASIRSTSVEETIEKLTDYEKSVLEASSALTTSHGFYETKVLDADGKIIEYYRHDQPTLEESMIITKITEGYIGESNDGGLTYATSISATGATVAQLTARLVYADQIIVGGQGASGELTVRDDNNNALVVLDKRGIVMADGTSIIGGNGVKSTFVFKTEEFADLGFWDISESEGTFQEKQVSLEYFIPSGMTVESAYIYLCIYPQYSYGAYFDTIAYTGYGRPINVKLYLQSDVRKKCHVHYAFVEEDVELNVGSDITNTTFNSSSLTPAQPSTPPQTALIIGSNYVSNNIASLLTQSSGKFIFKTTTPTWVTDHWNLTGFQYSGNLTANLVVVGYKT